MHLRPTIPAFRLPDAIATLGAHLPQWPHALACIAVLNVGIRLQLFSAEDLTRLENRTFLVEVLDSGCHARFTYRNGLFQPLFGTTCDGRHDLVFRANLSAFLQLLCRQEDPDSLFFNRALTIEGDTALGLTVKNMLDAIEWPKLRNLLQGCNPAHGHKETAQVAPEFTR